MNKIKTFLKKCIELVKEILCILVWFRYFILYTKRYGFVKHRNIGKRNKLVILGNGPSIKNIDFLNDKYKKVDFLCVNWFALDEKKFFSIKPKYYCIIDPVFFDENDVYHKERKEILASILNKINWKMYFITFSSYTNNIHFENKNLKVLLINNNIYKGKNVKLRNLLFKMNIASPVFQNVINVAIYFGITYKFKEVYLYGIENDWHRELYVDKNNDIIRKINHFYGTEDINLTKRGDIGKGDLDIYFYKYYITLNTYKILRSYSDFMSVCVYNCVENSYIDTFKKKSLTNSNRVKIVKKNSNFLKF